MVRINHPSMTKGTAREKNAQLEADTYVVEDATTSLDKKLAEFEGVQDIQEQKSPDAQPVPKPTVPNKVPEKSIQQSLENLIFIGRDSKVLDMAGHKFEISTLTHREHNHVIEELMSLGNAADLFAVRIYTLAYAVRKIDDKPLEQIELDGEFENDYAKKLVILDYLQFSLVEKLWKAYETLVSELDSNVYGENIKN
jgi:hypothetical protein